MAGLKIHDELERKIVHWCTKYLILTCGPSHLVHANLLSLGFLPFGSAHLSASPILCGSFLRLFKIERDVSQPLEINETSRIATATEAREPSRRVSLSFASFARFDSNLRILRKHKNRPHSMGAAD